MDLTPELSKRERDGDQCTGREISSIHLGLVTLSTAGLCVLVCANTCTHTHTCGIQVLISILTFRVTVY